MFPTGQMLYTKEETEVHKKKAYILVAFVCFVLCFCITVQYKSVTKNSSAGVKEAKRTEELENQLINANQEIINLKKENMQLASDIEIYRQEAASEDSGANALKAELEKALTAAGLTDVTGSGVVITLADSTEPVKQGEANDPYIVHDSDLRSVITELWGAGAEAISVNGERIVANSAVRCVGSTIMINNKRCASPFVINAVGNANSLESALNMRGGVLDVLRLYKISVNVSKESEILVKKYSGSYD